MTKLPLILAAGLGLISLADAAELNVGPASGSRVTATFKQEGVAVESPFTKFSGRITYDPAKVQASSALIEVQTGSFDFGDAAYNEEVRKKSWFDSGAHPKASFKSTAIKAGVAGSFVATGQLTLKGRVQTLAVPVKVSAGAKGSFVFDGSLTISRKAFGIGDPIWEGVVDDKVIIKFHLIGGKT